MKFSFAILLSVLGIYSSQSLAGTESSGGGPGILCPVGHSEPRMQSLDLYQGRILEGQTYAESSEDYKLQIERYINRLTWDRFFQMDLRKYVSRTIEAMHFLPEGVVLNVPPDLGGDEPIPLPRDCQAVGIGFYKDGEGMFGKDKLTISTDYFNLMSETQKAAFILHESVYLFIRIELGYLPEYSANSSLARWAVRTIMADVQNTDPYFLYKFARLSWYSYCSNDGHCFFPGKWKANPEARDAVQYVSIRTPLYIQSENPIYELTIENFNNRTYDVTLSCLMDLYRIFPKNWNSTFKEVHGELRAKSKLTLSLDYDCPSALRITTNLTDNGDVSDEDIKVSFSVTEFDKKTLLFTGVDNEIESPYVQGDIDMILPIYNAEQPKR